jgi:hypothetical protein
MKPAIPVIRYFAMPSFPKHRAQSTGREPFKTDSCAKRVPQAQRIRGMDSEGDGLSETTFENSIPGQFVLVGHRKIGNSAYSSAQNGVCVKSSDIFCMYFLELNFLPVEVPDI